MQGNSEIELGAKDAGKAQSFDLIASTRIGAPQPDLKPDEPPVVTLVPEQVEEIHVDDYSLLLFSATRIEPLSISEIKQQFPEPSPKKAQSVMDRFLNVGLVHLNKDGRYFSNYPHNYVNWGKYRYEADIVARQDAKVFQLVKDFFGDKQYWKDKMFFSIDAFFTSEQSAELREMFIAIKVKAKQFAQANAEARKLKGLTFRRVKFFDMTFGFFLAVLITMGTVGSVHARGGSGTDPVSYRASYEAMMLIGGGTGTDPGHRMAPECLSSSDARLLEHIANGGGGHDPSGDGSTTQVQNDGGGGHDPTEICKLGSLMKFVRMCQRISNDFCSDVRDQAVKIWRSTKSDDQSAKGLDI